MTEKGLCCYCTHIDFLTQQHFVSDAPPFSFPKKSGLVLCPVKCVPLSFLWHTYELRIVYVFGFVFAFCIQCTSFFSLTWCIFSRRIIPPSLAADTPHWISLQGPDLLLILGRPHFLYWVLSLMEQQAVPTKAPPFLQYQDKTPKCVTKQTYTTQLIWFIFQPKSKDKK